MWVNSCGSRALEHRLGGCGARAKLLCGMWDLSGPGIEPVPPALAGDFFTTEPQRSPSHDISLKRSENGTTLPPHNTNDKKKSGSLRCCASSTMPAT